MKKFNVLNGDFNSDKIGPYDVIPHFVRVYNNLDKKRKTEVNKDFKSWVISEAKYQYWARCEYEIIVSDWPCNKNSQKIDVCYQILMNIDIIVDILKEELKIKDK